MAQNSIEKYQSLANELYDQSKYTSAIDIFERLLFFGTDKQNRSIYLPLARCYNAIGEYEKATVNYNNAYNSQRIDTIRYDILIESAINFMMDKDTSLAYSELLNIPETGISHRINDKLRLLMGTLDYKSGRYQSAKNHFLAISSLTNANKKEVAVFINKAYKISRRYNPIMVQWMSLIPGLGQAWCGYYKESANAFLLSGALVLLFADVSYQYNLIDGLLSVYPWFNRYYKGGITKSYKLAERKRETEKNKLYNSFLKSIPPIN